MKPFSDDKKIEILNYAAAHGVTAAARHYGISSQRISQWNRRLKIYKPKPTEYPPETRRAVLSYAATHGATAAAKKYGVSKNIITLWNRADGAYANKTRRFSVAEQKEILGYARDFGARAAARRFDVELTTVIRWNNKYKIYEPQKTYTHDEIMDVLTYARDFSLVSAARRFNIPEFTITRWNKKYKVYDMRAPRDYTPYTPAQQRQILLHALRVYKLTPPANRTARSAFLRIAPEYNLTIDQLYIWNRKFHIVPVRFSRNTELSASDIENIQATLNQSRGRIAPTARKTGHTAERVGKLVKSKRIAFNRATATVKTKMRPRPSKAALISSIVDALLHSKSE